jgi:hypothetical protein
VCPYKCHGLLNDRKRGAGNSFQIVLHCLGCQHKANYTFPRDATIMEGDTETIFLVPNQAYLRTPFPVPMKPLVWVKMSPPTSGASKPTTPAPSLTNKPLSPYLTTNPLALTKKRLRASSPSSSGSWSSSRMASPAPTPTSPFSPTVGQEDVEPSLRTASPAPIPVSPPSPMVAQEDLQPDPVEEVTGMLGPVGLGPMIPRNLSQKDKGVKRMRKTSDSQVIKKKKSRSCRDLSFP